MSAADFSGMRPPPAPLPLDVAVDLAHALIQRHCDELELRVLFLKGPAAHHQGLRRRSISTDVDAFLTEEDAHRLEASLLDAGWSIRPSGMEGVALRHAVTLIHEHWPVDIDIHHHIPGVAPLPGEVFNSLWARHDHVELAHWRVDVPDRVDHALILLLNILRSGPHGGSDPRLGVLADALDDDAMRTLDRRIAEFDCGPQVAPFVRRHGRGLLTLDTRVPDHTWLLYQHLDQPALLWLDGVVRAPWRRKPALLLNAVHPSRHVLSERNLTLIEAPRREVFAARTRRLVRTVVHLPTLLRTYQVIRRSSRARGE